MKEPSFEELFGPAPAPISPLADTPAAPPELGYAARWRAPLGAIGAMDAALAMLRARPGVFFCVVVFEAVVHSCRPVVEALVPGAGQPSFVGDYFGPPSWPGWVLDPLLMAVIFAAFACIYHGLPATPSAICRTAFARPISLFVVDAVTNLLQILAVALLVLPFVFLWGWIIFAVPHVVLGRANIGTAFQQGFRDGGKMPRALMGLAALYIVGILALTWGAEPISVALGNSGADLLRSLLISPFDAFFMLAVTWLYFELRAGWKAPAQGV